MPAQVPLRCFGFFDEPRLFQANKHGDIVHVSNFGLVFIFLCTKFSTSADMPDDFFVDSFACLPKKLVDWVKLKQK